MSGERLSMRKIRELLWLDHWLPQRAVVQSLGLSQGAVHGYMARTRRAGLPWPLPEALDDSQLEAPLYPPPPAVATEQRPVQDRAEVHRELRRPNMTLALLWEEYRAWRGMPH
jgi:transposase